MRKNNLRKAILAILGASALVGYSNQAAAANSKGNVGGGDGILLGVAGATLIQTNNTADGAPSRSFADYGTNSNYGWTHKAHFYEFQVGSVADIAVGTRFDVTVDLKANGSTPTNPPMTNPGFSIWTSGSAGPLTFGNAHDTYGHHWSQVRGPFDGGVGGDPCGTVGDCSLGSNGWMGTNGGGNLVSGRDGWIGYANGGYSFTNGDGDKLQGLYAGASNAGNIGQYADGSALTNVNSSSPYVKGGYATLVAADTMLTLQGLKAGYYGIALGGACPDNALNGQNCSAVTAQTYKLTLSNSGVSAVPVPGAVWLFGSAMMGLIGMSRRKDALKA